MKIIAISNQKGGVGKTTTAVSVATGLQLKGFKTLLIDTDSQCNSTDTYGAKIKNVATLYDLLFEDELIEECIQKTDVGYIIASDPLLSSAEQKFPNDVTRFILMREKLKKLNGFDYVIIDTPPTMGVMISNVFSACDNIIIPVTCDRYGLAGIELLHKTISDTKEYTNSKLTILGFLLIKFKENYNINKDIEQSVNVLAENLNTKVFSSKIRESVACRESQAVRKSIFEYAPKSSTAEDYKDLINEIIGE